MSIFYNPRRKERVYDPKSREPYKIGRSKIELYIECPKCFYLDRRLGVARPPGYPFTLNTAVDTLLKKEFDLLRKNGEAHPLMKKYKIDAVPAVHEKIDEWRNNFKGVQFLHKPTNFIITGAIDDLWQNPKGEYIVVDYKSTSKSEEITELNQEWQDGYKRQMEVYQWLLRQNGYKVSSTGYFVYCNGNTKMEKFDGKLEFDITIIPYIGNDNWVEKSIFEIHDCLNNDSTPKPSSDCDYCAYRESVSEAAK